MARLNGYTPQQSVELYPTTGDFDDYMYGELGTLTYTIELGTQFIPPESEVAPIVQKNVECCLYLLREAADPFPLVDHTPLATSANPQGPYRVTARLGRNRRPGFESPVLTLYYRSGDAPEGQATMPQGADGLFEAAIPGAGITTHRYWIVATGSGGQTVRIPESGEHSFRVVERLVLVVADDGGRGYDAYYTRPLQTQATDHRVFRTRTDGTLTPEDLASASAVVWFTGDQYTQTLTAEDQALLKGYLDKGGRLALFGQDLGYDIKESVFYRDVLKARFIRDTASSTSVTGQGFLAGLAAEIGPSTDGVSQRYPEVIEALAGATVLATYADGTTGGLSVATARHRIAYLGFGLEGVSGEDRRAALLGRVLTWLAGSSDPGLAGARVGLLVGP